MLRDNTCCVFINGIKMEQSLETPECLFDSTALKKQNFKEDFHTKI